MVQPVINAYRFCLGRSQYKRVRARGWLFFGGFLLVALGALVLGGLLWGTYTHTFTPYLKWQDALVALLWFIAFASLGGSITVVRFLCALHAGYRQGMLTLTDDNTLTVRDLSHENLISIFWMVNSAFWCFVVVLVGLVPLILIEWTLHLPTPALAVLATGLAIILSLAGLAVSIIAAGFIVIGCIGAVSFCRKVGSSHVYKLSSEITLRIDNFVLTIICPGKAESMIELDLLTPGDQCDLLSLLYKRWKGALGQWNPELGEEITQALEKAEQTPLIGA
jgi:MFS family permease